MDEAEGKTEEKVVKFPGVRAVPEARKLDDPELETVASVVEGFAPLTEEMSRVLIISIDKKGRLGWSSNAADMCEVTWMSAAMNRMAMDMSMGILDE